MVRGKLTLVSSKLKAGENICFIFISTFLKCILIEHCITASLGSGILFQNISPMLPAYDALVHTCSWISVLGLNSLWVELNFSELCRYSLTVPPCEWELRPWNQTRVGPKSPPPPPPPPPCLKRVYHGHRVLSTVWFALQGCSHC